MPVHRLCEHIICGCKWGTHGTCYVCCRPRRSCLVFVVSKPQWPAAPSSPTSISIVKECCYPYIYLSRAYLNMSDCVTHIWPIPMVCNDIRRDIPKHDPPPTYVRTYILCENRSLIQSLALMCLAITMVIQLLQHWCLSVCLLTNLST